MSYLIVLGLCFAAACAFLFWACCSICRDERDDAHAGVEHFDRAPQ